MKNKDHQQVRPVSPVAGYIGGKRQLAKRLVALVESTGHDLYAEPFVGMGGIFFRRPARAPVEAINDLNGDVANFFRILQRHYEPFLDMLKWRLSSREDFDRLMATPPETLTDLERAARFLQLQRLAFGGKVAGRNFGVATTQPARFDMAKVVPLLAEAHERLTRVWIENLPYAEFIRRYDRPGALFYCDPPYWGSEGYYGRDLFTRADFEALAAALRGIKGRFILSVNDVPELRELFDWASIATAELSYSAGGRNDVKAREIIVTGGAR